jgi:hypothetical protein
MPSLLGVLDARFVRLPFEAPTGLEVRRYRWRPEVANEPALADRLLAAVDHRLKQRWWQSPGALIHMTPAVRSGRIVLEASYELEGRALSRVRVVFPTDAVRVSTFAAEGRDLSGSAAITGRVHLRASGGERLAIVLVDGLGHEARLALEPRHVLSGGRILAPLADFTGRPFDWTDCRELGVDVFGEERGAGSLVVEELGVQ